MHATGDYVQCEIHREWHYTKPDFSGASANRPCGRDGVRSPIMTVSRTAEETGKLVTKFAGVVATGSSLVVGQDDTAIFARFGQILRVVDPGTYQVAPEFAGDGIEVYFVSGRPNMGVKFGGNLGPVPGSSVKTVFGECAYQVANPEQLVRTLLGFGCGWY